MELNLTPEQQAKLEQEAAKSGTDPVHLATTVVANFLEREAQYRAAVEEGLAQMARGEFLEEEEMDARVEAMLRT